MAQATDTLDITVKLTYPDDTVVDLTVNVSADLLFAGEEDELMKLTMQRATLALLRKMKAAGK
jgi:hypothetical protein